MNKSITRPTFNLVCSNYPPEFEHDKTICQAYFRQFGKVIRLIYKQRRRVIVVEYIDHESYMEALKNGGQYLGHSFSLQPFESRLSSVPPARPVIPVKKKLSYIDKNEIHSELAAMSGYSDVNAQIDFSAAETSPIVRTKHFPRLNRVWQRGQAVPAKEPKKARVKKNLAEIAIKNKAKETLKVLNAEQLDLLKVMRSQSHTVEEKFKVLDARDKLLRYNSRISNLKLGPTIGTCTDMCPEKERLLREVQHQVAFYEQDEGGRHFMNPHKAVKQYSRSSADQETPLPHELRPVNVLEFTMKYLIYTFIDLCEIDSEVNIGEWYHFLWDRTRSIRKDITQQALCSQGAVELVEQCARFHIHCSARLTSEDPSVFDHRINTENLTKCLQTLKYMYNDLQLKHEICPNEAEFRGYVILLNLNDGNFMWEVQNLPETIQKSPEIKFALQIYSAFDKNNYVKFFKLIKSTTYLNACILMRYFVQVRSQALSTLLKCFTPPRSISFFPLEELTDLLYFDSIDATVDFLNAYGLSVGERNQVLFDRSIFKDPEYPYMLDRSELVENKRHGSVGETVSGKPLTPKFYIELEGHKLHNSFDNDGFLIQDELFNEVELRIEEKLLDGPDSRESTPERKTPVVHSPIPKAPKLENTTNIFSSKSKNKPENLFGQNIVPKPPIKDISIFNQGKPDSDIFNQEKKENIFASGKMYGNIFQQKKEANIFQIKDTPVNTSNTTSKENIFQTFNTQTRPSDNIFSTKSTGSEGINIFAGASNPPLTTISELVVPTTLSTSSINIFTTQKYVSQPKSESKKGGFSFNLDTGKPPETSNIYTSYIKNEDKETEENEEETDIDSDQDGEDELDHIETEEAQRIEFSLLEKEEAQELKIKEDLAKEKMEKEQKEREERERNMREEQEMQRRSMEERKRKQEQQRQQQIEEQRKLSERNSAVQLVLNKLIEEVEKNIKEEILGKVRKSIKRIRLLRICKRWRNIAVRRLRKRKAMDCVPIWINDKNVGQCAQGLHSKSQDLTLQYMKRYRLGQPLDIPLLEDRRPNKLNLFYLTYSSLRRRLCELKEKWHQHIYWKVVVSIPDIDEMVNGLHRLEETLKAYASWKLNKYGQTLYIEECKTVTYCVEKQQGVEIKSHDANGFIFIGKSFSDEFQKRIFENLSNFGVYVKLPIIIVLEDTTSSEEYLDRLRDTGVVSDYVIYSCNLNGSALPSIIDNGLVCLSKKVEKYPPLEMDTLFSFLMKNLCTEIWRKAESYAKWNHEYNFCMRDPNILIKLHNQALTRLSDIILDKKRKEYNIFPEVFRDYLPDKYPDFLPCDYRYFPRFWSDPSYEASLREVLNQLKLPKFLHVWPPHNETELIISVSKYCTEIFKNPKGPYITILNILKHSMKNDHYNTILWTKAMEAIAIEKLKEQNLILPKKYIYEDIFKTLVVVYDVNLMNNYCTCEWFYRNNPLIEGFKKTVDISSNLISPENPNPKKRKTSLDLSMDREDILKVINKAENILSSPKNLKLEYKDKIEQFKRSMRDLEESIAVVKRMDEMNLLQKFLEN